MITKKQHKMLKLLDEKILKCEKCGLYKNGRCKPYYNTKTVKYVIIGEAPGKNEVEQGIPFIGKAGNILWTSMEKFGLKREDFLIINSVNCRALNGKKNGKPTKEQKNLCFDWVRKYIKVLDPDNCIILGAHALSLFSEDVKITDYCGETLMFEGFSSRFIINIHPAYCLYDSSKIEKFEDSIRKFKEKII
jgi:DNA polymerase